MSLSEAILEIVEDIETEANTPNKYSPDARQQFTSFAKQLRRALKAAESHLPVNGISSPLASLIAPEAQHTKFIEEARLKLREERQRASVQESDSDTMRVIADGPEEGLSVMIPSSMPVDAKTRINNQTYILKHDGQLYLHNG